MGDGEGGSSGGGPAGAVAGRGDDRDEAALAAGGERAEEAGGVAEEEGESDRSGEEGEEAEGEDGDDEDGSDGDKNLMPLPHGMYAHMMMHAHAQHQQHQQHPHQPAKMRTLYVGNLSQQFTESVLLSIFATAGQVLSVKIIRDRSTGMSLGYGFVEFVDHESASSALLLLNGRRFSNTDLKINWASGGSKSDSNGFSIFVGDLSSEVDDQYLGLAFAEFQSMTEARVMMDHNTGRSRGYGFVTFASKSDAARAIDALQGQFIGSRKVRCNWASQKGAGDGGQAPFNVVVSQAPATNTTVYVGNLVPDADETFLREAFSQFGVVVDIRLFAHKNFAFVRFESHQQAAAAIANAQGQPLLGRPMRLGWGRERPQPLAGFAPFAGGMRGPMTTAPAYHYAAYYAQAAQQPLAAPQLGPQGQRGSQGYPPMYMAPYQSPFPSYSSYPQGPEVDDGPAAAATAAAAAAAAAAAPGPAPEGDAVPPAAASDAAE